MRTAESMTENEQAHRLLENLVTHLSHGKEWATPGVQAALQRVVAGLDTGVESASPRLQALLRRLAEDLAGGVETLTPRVQEGLRRAVPKAAPEVRDVATVDAGQTGSRTWLWLAGLLLVVMAGAGAVAWRSARKSDEEAASSTTAQGAGDTAMDVDPDLASGQI